MLNSAALLLPTVYDDLLHLANARLSRFRPPEISTAADLVHEVYVRLAEGRRTGFEGCRHFFFAAARAMRDILVEKARQKASLKRGGGTVQVVLDAQEIAMEVPRGQVLDLIRALASGCDRNGWSWRTVRR